MYLFLFAILVSVVMIMAMRRGMMSPSVILEVIRVKRDR
jgi:hypothetical protein